jgi:hypothetical protein
MLMLHVDHFAGDACRFRCARQFSRPAFAHLLVNAGCVEVVIVTNENSTIDPTYDVNDASDGP